MTGIWRISLAIEIVAAVHASAAIHVTRHGAPVAGAQICTYAAAGTQNPFVQQLASNAVTCTASATLPPGLWNVYAQLGTSAISGRVVLAETKDEVELRLEPAATLEIAAPKGAYAVAYLTDTTSVYPLRPGASAIIVPARRQLLPLLVSDRKIVAAAAPQSIEEGKSASAGAFGDALVTWLSIAPADLAALRTARTRRPPEVIATTSKGRVIKPVNPLIGTTSIDRALQIFRPAPREAMTIEVRGVPWKRQQIVVAAAAAVVEQPLRLIPTSSAIIEWFAASNIDDLADGLVASCKPKPSKKGGLTVSILKCGGIQRDDCKVITEQSPSPGKSGRIHFDDLQPDTYVAELRYRDLPPVRETFRLRKFDQETLRLPLEYAALFGRVTIGGDPPPSPLRLEFGHTGAQRTVTDEHGQYLAVLAKPPKRDDVISLRGCDQKIDSEFIVESDVAPNGRLDIDLPANTLTVEAVDAASGAPVAGAVVRYGAFRSGDMKSFYFFRLAFKVDDDGNSTLQRTGADGRLTVENLPPGKTVNVCVEHEDYERTCAESFELTSTQKKTLRVAMKPVSAFRGRVRAPFAIAGGDVYWFAPDGQPTERVHVKEDGTFRYAREHDVREVVAVVAINLPLYVFRQPALPHDDLFDIALPAAPVRRFEVSLSEENAQSDAIVTIAVGDLVVPYPPFAQHLALHGSMLQLRNRGPLLVPDILQTGPIFALLGPPPSEVTPDMLRIDLFRLPQFRNVPRRAVGGDAKIVFGRATVHVAQR